MSGKVKAGGVGGGTSKASTTTKKLGEPPLRLLREVDINAIYPSLCK
jgi:hypothetical protein